MRARVAEPHASGLAIVACALAVVLMIACKKSGSDEADAAPPTNANASPTENATTDPTAEPRPLPPIEQNADVVVLGVDTTTTAGSVEPPPPPPDPFVPATDSVRQSALGCFSQLPSGTYFATIVVVVTPAGTPIDVTVEPGNVPDPAVVACLKQAGDGRTYPSSPNGRTLRIDVRVTG